MTATPSPIKNRRRRNPGHAVSSKPEDVDARAMIVRKFDLPRAQREMTREEAHLIGVAFRTELAVKIGVHPQSLSRWSRVFTDFPKPIARCLTAGGGDLYSAHEVFAWVAAAIKAGRIRSPKKRS